MRKLDLANEIKKRVGGVSKKEVQVLIDILLKTVGDTLFSGEMVKISGFGTFKVKAKKDRKGRNPASGKSLTIAARKVVTFRPSQLLRDMLNR